MSACLGICHRNIRDAVDGEGIVEAAVIAQYAAVAVGGVFAETYICHDEEVWEAGAEKSDGLDDGARRVVGGGTEGVFSIGIQGNAEEDDGAETFGDKGFEVGD